MGQKALLAPKDWQWAKGTFHLDTGSLSLAWSWQWVKALCCYCRQTCRRLPVSSKWLEAYQSVPDNFPDCFAREVLEDWPWEWGTLLVPEDSWCSRRWCWPAFLWGKAVASFPAAAGPMQAPGVAQGTRDRTHEPSLCICALNRRSGQTGQRIPFPSWAERFASQDAVAHRQRPIRYIPSRAPPQFPRLRERRPAGKGR